MQMCASRESAHANVERDSGEQQSDDAAARPRMTDEEEVGFFLKRGRAAELTLGDGTYHRDRFARLNGY